MRVMWRFVHNQGVEDDELREWWQLHNQLEVGQTYWRHQWVADQIQEVWTIPVLCSAIIGSDLVDTSAREKTALRLLSNTPIASEVEQQRYTEFMADLKRSYRVLLQGIDDDIRAELEAITRKK